MAHKSKDREPVWTWEREFEKPGFVSVPVSSFRHVPLGLYWTKLAIKDMLVETKLVDTKLPNDAQNAYWIARVLEFAGYLAKISYEGYGNGNNENGNVRWVHFCEDLFRIGHCAENRLPIVPPASVIEMQKDWREWIIQRVTGGYTMHPMMGQLITYDNETQLQKGMEVEVLDKSCISRMRLGTVQEVIGHRVHVRYWDADPNSDEKGNEFWCHEQSDSINVVGWSKTIGHDISAPPNYNPHEVTNSTVLRKDPGVKVKIGMKLEAVDPLNLSIISAATVVKVLKHGFFMIRIESVVEQQNSGTQDGSHGNSWFCYHITSPLIFPCGFCKENNIKLMPPHEYTSPDAFDWKDYLSKTGSEPLPLHEVPKEKLEHGFVEGAKLEAVDVMEPDLICVATIAKVIGRLLRIRFDGWGEDYDQWADAASCDLFPIGWCRLMNYALQPPHVPQKEKIVSPPAAKKQKTKGAGGGKKQRRSTASLGS